MRIPRKIDDRLKDAIVSLQFEPGVPANAVEGAFYTLLKDNFQEITLGQSNTIQIDQLIIQPQKSFYVHQDGKFRVDINANSITFNLVDTYAGWHEYFHVIRETLTPLFENKIILSAVRIGIRYISVFEQIRIFDCINSTLSFNPFDDKSSKAQFRIELDRNPFQVIVTLLNAFPKTFEGPLSEFYSVTDIDTIKMFLPGESNIKNVLLWLDSGHSEQKEVFFSLLQQEFISSLNPEY